MTTTTAKNQATDQYYIRAEGKSDDATTTLQIMLSTRLPDSHGWASTKGDVAVQTHTVPREAAARCLRILRRHCDQLNADAVVDAVLHARFASYGCGPQVQR